MAIAAGQIARAADIAPALSIGAVVRRGERNTNESGIDGTERGILRVDNIPIVAGRRYAVRCTPSRVLGGTDQYALRLRVNQTGQATASSTQLCYAQMPAGSHMTPAGEFTATVTGSSCSVLLSVQRITGTGTGTWWAEGTDGSQIMSIVDMGDDPGDTGIEL